MAKCYFKVGLFDPAKEEYQRVLELDSEHLAALYALGEIYYEEKQFDLALKYFERVLQADRFNESATQRIARLRRNATAELSPLSSNGGDASYGAGSENSISTLTLAEIYASQGLTEKAISVLRRLLDRTSNNTDVMNRIQELEQQRQMTEAEGDNGNNS